MKVRKFFYNLVFLLSMFAVLGCNFSSETQDEDNFRNFNSDEKGTILVTLKSKNNELFSQSSSQNTNDSSKRSAVPSSLSALYASAFAFKCELKNADGTISVPLDNIKLENSILSMEFGVVSFARTDYKLSINAVDPDDTNVILLVPESGTIPVNIAARGDTFSTDVELVPYSSISDVAKYYGSVKLGLQIPSGYTLDYSDSSGNKPFGNLSIEDGVYKISASVKAGQYSTYFYIKKNGEIVDVLLETIHVYPKMQTDRWNTGNADATKNIRIINSVQVGNTFFVSSNPVVSGGVFATLGSAGGDDSASGSIKKPYATIQKPLSKIKNIYDSGQTFTIYVEGTVTSGTGANSVDFSSFANTQNIYLIGLKAAQETGSLNFYPTGEGQTLNLGGEIFVKEIKLKKGCTITAQNNLSCVSGKSIITTIIPEEYTGGTQILVAGDGVVLSNVVNKFEIKNDDNSKKWYIDSEGKLQKKLYDTVYLDSTATVDGEGGIVTSPVKTFESALSVLNKSATSPEIVIMKAYTLSSGEENILDFSEGFTNKVTLKRYSDCTGNLISVMDAMQGKTVTIKNAIFDGANIANAGGSLLNICLNSGEATVNVSNSVFKNNNYGTSTYDSGGAIYNNRTLTIDNSKISNNTATSGGGIYNNGTLTVSNIIISGNTATYGKGICNFGTKTLNLSNNLQIEDNIYLSSISSSPSIKIQSDFSLKSDSLIPLGCSNFSSSIGSSIIESLSGSMTQDICDKFTLPDTYSLAASGAYGILATSVNGSGIEIEIPNFTGYTATLSPSSPAFGGSVTLTLKKNGAEVTPSPCTMELYTLDDLITPIATSSATSLEIPSYLSAIGNKNFKVRIIAHDDGVLILDDYYDITVQ